MSDDNNLKIERGRAWWGDFREENFGFTIFDEIEMISFDGRKKNTEKCQFLRVFFKKIFTQFYSRFEVMFLEMSILKIIAHKNKLLAAWKLLNANFFSFFK